MAAHRITAFDPGDLVETVPHLMGFAPSESIVLLPLQQGPTVPVARVDVPLTRTDRIDAADRLTEAYRRANAQGTNLALVCLTEDPTAAMPAIDAITGMLEHAEIFTPVRVVATDHQWWDLTQHATGQRDQSARERIAAEAAFAGIAAPLSSRDDLVAELEGYDPDVRQILDDGQVEGFTSTTSAEQWALGVVEKFRRDREPLDVDATARMLDLMTNTDVLETLWQNLDRATAAEDVALWINLTQRAPNTHQSGPAIMLGYAAWIAGNGARSVVALDAVSADRRMDEKPMLLSVIQSACVAPTLWDEFKSTPGVVEAVTSKEEINAAERDISRGRDRPGHQAPGI